MRHHVNKDKRQEGMLIDVTTPLVQEYAAAADINNLKAAARLIARFPQLDTALDERALRRALNRVVDDNPILQPN